MLFMRYKSKFAAKFDKGSYCYLCFPKKRKNAVLYEVNMTGKQRVTDMYTLDREGYNNYLLCYTLAGKGKMSYGGREFTLEPKDLAFIDCANRHQVEVGSGGDWEFVFLHFSGLGASYLYDCFTELTGNKFEGYDGKVLLEKTAELHTLLSAQPKVDCGDGGYSVNLDDDGVLCATAELVYSVMVDIVKKLAAIPGELPHRMKTAIDFIHENFTHKITLEDCAKKVYLSKYHFERMFIRYTGKTFFEYVTHLRFERARLLLDSTAKSLMDIATEIGYADIQPLNKLFKKNFGVTPTVYRKTRDNYK